MLYALTGIILDNQYNKFILNFLKRNYYLVFDYDHNENVKLIKIMVQKLNEVSELDFKETKTYT